MGGPRRISIPDGACFARIVDETRAHYCRIQAGIATDRWRVGHSASSWRGVQTGLSVQILNEKVERETGFSAPSTNHSVEFTYRLG